MIPIKFVVEQGCEGISLFIYASVRMSTKFLPAEFTCADFSDHPDREQVGKYARQIIDGLFTIPSVAAVTIHSGSLILTVHPREDWWIQHKSEVEIVLERALEVDEVIFIEGV